ncbi:MAG: cytochrome c [Rhodobacterales bacterium]|nr:cytochrome c [Rhodobacterales bacterium]
MTKSLVLSAVLAILAIGGSVQAQQIDVGAQLYQDYCAACHGASGKGDGDMANVITIPSPDLTLLARNNGGAFPMLQVVHIIDGRTGVRAHGGAMPVFGRVFAHDPTPGQSDWSSLIEARGKVLSLATYLDSIQAK